MQFAFLLWILFNFIIFSQIKVISQAKRAFKSKFYFLFSKNFFLSKIYLYLVFLLINSILLIIFVLNYLKIMYFFNIDKNVFFVVVGCFSLLIPLSVILIFSILFWVLKMKNPIILKFKDVDAIDIENYPQIQVQKLNYNLQTKNGVMSYNLEEHIRSKIAWTPRGTKLFYKKFINETFSFFYNNKEQLNLEVNYKISKEEFAKFILKYSVVKIGEKMNLNYFDFLSFIKNYLK
ncbi:Uncharacterised protein [Mycoplasmopsis gallopavonis]|uniref:Transmembrane protein n=1 Tax=Mycoplasmopsis gallopavonis TaxID=76629 RepID=A0A449AYS4_9BACT|nr:Uncharacterised protein [Mycoplasmopsis gallopavonis]